MLALSISWAINLYGNKITWIEPNWTELNVDVVVGLLVWHFSVPFSCVKCQGANIDWFDVCAVTSNDGKVVVRDPDLYRTTADGAVGHPEPITVTL